MMNLETGTVVVIEARRPGLARVTVQVGNALSPAFALSPLGEALREGDAVLLNTTAAHLGLGSGQGHPIVANLSRPDCAPGPVGHEMKVRYTPSQLATAATRSEVGSDDVDLGGMVVVVAELHSALAPILGAMGAAWAERDTVPPPVAYLMPDWSCLPVAISDTVARAREIGRFAFTVTTGQAFGGDVEAAGMPAGLALAHERGARIVIVTGGPGHLGAHQPFGFSSAAQSDALHVTHALGGRPVLAPRLSAADPRPRHRGISHHTACILGRLLLVPAVVPVPETLDAELRGGLAALAARSGSVVSAVQLPDYVGACRGDGLALESMGRGREDDPLYFDVAAAAGAWAAGSCDS